MKSNRDDKATHKSSKLSKLGKSKLKAKLNVSTSSHSVKAKTHTKIADVLKELGLKKHADVKAVHPTKFNPVKNTTADTPVKLKPTSTKLAAGAQPPKRSGTADHAAESVTLSTVTSSTDKKAKFIDLYPWPFEKTFKGVIRHREWNALVKKIQEAVDCESAHENDHLQEEIAHLLDERDALQKKLTEMREFVLKRNREFEAQFN